MASCEPSWQCLLGHIWSPSPPARARQRRGGEGARRADGALATRTPNTTSPVVSLIVELRQACRSGNALLETYGSLPYYFFCARR